MEQKDTETNECRPRTDEKGLIELFVFVLQQWKWFISITVLGLLMSVVIAFVTDKQYVMTAQVSRPDSSDVMSVTNKGYSAFFDERHLADYKKWRNAKGVVELNTEQTADITLKLASEDLFKQYYDLLKSPAHFNRYVQQGKWRNRIDSLEVPDGERNQIFAGLRKGIKVAIVSPMQPKKGKELPPRIIALTMMGVNEALMADFINQYIDYTNNALLVEIKQAGRERAAVEVTKLRASMGSLRLGAKIEREAQMVKLREVLALAKKVGIKKPDSIRLYSGASQHSILGLTSNANGERGSLFLMGSEYLEGEIENLSLRTNDDPYITRLVPLITRIKQIEALSFDFTGVRLYKIDKLAMLDGIAEKPKRALIVAVGGVVSLFVGMLVALVIGLVRRRKLLGMV